MKPALITYKKGIKTKDLKDFQRKLLYEKYFILTHESKIDPLELKKFKKFEIIECKKQQIPNKIDEIMKNNEKKYIIFPYFSGDVNSKYAIKVYNNTYGLKINPSSFRIKSKMSEFLGKETSQKKSLKLSYAEIQKANFADIKQEIGEHFILKPVNAAASLLNFRISSEENFENIKKKLKKKYQYVIEEYLDGNLYSIDFFCNGKEIFLLCFAREIPFLEMIEKFSPKYLEKYQETLRNDFLHFLPIRYTLDLKKISNLELDFINKIGKKLIEKNYHGLIHLEYKVNRKDKKIGFIEWGARTGGQRNTFIDKMHGLRVENLPIKILLRKDFSRFEKKKGLYFLKNRNIDKNFVGIKTSVFEKTPIIKVLNKIPKFLNVSFETFLREFLWDHWKIKIEKVDFSLITTSEGYIYPFYERSDTKLDYVIEIKEGSFQKFLKQKHAILERLVFHDYKM